MKVRFFPASVSLAIALSLPGCAPTLKFIETGGNLEATALAAKESGSKSMGAAERAVENINANDERAVGQAAALSVIQKNGGLVLEEDLNAYVNEVGNLIALQGKRAGLANGQPRVASRRVFVGVLDSKNQNAFSLPGGYILVTRGLLEALGSESELAWVLGHEMAHADNEHGLEALKLQVRAGTAAGSFVTGGLMDFKDSKFFSKLSDGFVTFLLEKGWDSKAEMTADSEGLRYSTAAGYDARGAQRVLRLMNTRYLAGKTDAEKNNKTHASPEARWKNIRAAVEKVPAAKDTGRLGVERYEARCIARLDAYVAAAPASSEGGAP